MDLKCNYESYEKFLREYYKPKDFWNLTLKDAVKKINKAHKLIKNPKTDDGINEAMLFETLHEIWEVNLCDDCGVIDSSSELVWNSMGCICSECYANLNQNEKEKFDEE